MMDRVFRERGFLPGQDPLAAFPSGSPLSMLDELGRDLPSLLEDPHFRTYARELSLPPPPRDRDDPDFLQQLRLYYVRVGFLASAYINQTSQERATSLPQNLAAPLCAVCTLLRRPAILSYDGYALYNWKRFDRSKPVTLGNIDTIQNFVHMYDEHWFILVHVEIEAIAARILAAIARVAEAAEPQRAEIVRRALVDIASAMREQIVVLRRLPEKMDPALYHRTFRPYIRFFENVVYEGVSEGPMNFRGETGAQSSIMPALVSFMKIPHKPSVLTNHLADMRRFMPPPHRELLGDIEAMRPIRDSADREAFNDVLEQMATFRETHYKWAHEYINRWTDDPRGTGGTPYMSWLKQLIDETRGHKL
jgi:indoleamine 2,3-dioxygenase